MGLYIYISSDDFGRSLFNIHINIIVPKNGKMKTIGKMYTVRRVINCFDYCYLHRYASVEI